MKKMMKMMHMMMTDGTDGTDGTGGEIGCRVAPSLLNSYTDPSSIIITATLSLGSPCSFSITRNLTLIDDTNCTDLFQSQADNFGLPNSTPAWMCFISRRKTDIYSVATGYLDVGVLNIDGDSSKQYLATLYINTNLIGEEKPGQVFLKEILPPGELNPICSGHITVSATQV